MRVSQHTAQASAKAPFGTRLYIVDIGKLNTPWTIQMVNLKVSNCIRSTMTELHNMTAGHGVSLVTGLRQAQQRPPCFSHTRYSLARPFAETSILLPHRDSKYSSHAESWGLAAALILIYRTIGVSEADTNVYCRFRPSADCSSHEKIQNTVKPATFKYKESIT